MDRRRVTVVQDQGRVGGAGPEALQQIGRERGPVAPDAAAIGDDPIGSVAQLEGKGRCAAAGQRPAGGWRRGVENSDALLHRHPLIPPTPCLAEGAAVRSEEHTSELQSLMRTSYAVC